MNTTLIPFRHQYSQLASIFDAVAGTDVGFPFYNISADSDGTYIIEVALAGYRKEDVEIELKPNLLIVTGDSRNTVNQLMEQRNRTYYAKNISERKFVRKFTLADYTRVVSAKMSDGMRSIVLKREIPEEQKVAINID